MSENPHWERELLEKLATATLIEQRRARRWKIFFRLVWLIVFLAVGFKLTFKAEDTPIRLRGIAGQHTAVLQLEGIIDSENNTADKIIQGLQKAYDHKGTRGILIRANSPGGSPVLAGMIYDEIRRLKKLYPAIPIYVVVEETCASGCYYIAAAADKIYVNKASIIGSIGVISDSFGFTHLMEKLGIERRLQTAGANKAMGDPFLPVNPQQIVIQQQLLDTIHQQFIHAVKEGRGTLLKPTSDMFSGRIWLGENSLALGIADGYGTIDSVAREVIKAEEIVDFTQEDDTVSRIARRFGLASHSALHRLFEARLF